MSLKYFTIFQIIKLFLAIVLIITSTCNTFSQDILAGRVANYTFNGNSNDNIASNHGIVHGAVLVSDRFGNAESAYQFDGVNDFLEIPTDPAVNFGANENFSISIWVNVFSNQNDLNGDNNEILGKWNALTSAYPYAIRYWNKNAAAENKGKTFALRYDSNSGSCKDNPIITGPCPITIDKWHHLVYRKNNSTLSLFQDGVLVGLTEDDTKIGCNTINNHPIFLGKRALNNRYFTGIMDDLVFYDRALTDDEIILLFEENDWKIEAPTELLFGSFNIQGQIGSTVINVADRTIKVEVECFVDKRNLIAEFSHTMGTAVTIDGIEQVSGVTSNDFNKPLLYTITSKNGCYERNWTVIFDEQSLFMDDIDISREPFVIPNVFTPNGDGVNDVFQVGRNLVGSEVFIFNRWGKTVYHNANYTNDFDGSTVSPGLYFYLIISPCLNNSIKGYVSILK